MSKVMKEMGRKGGKIGGKRSLVTMTPEERSARARQGGLAGGRGRPKRAEAVPVAPRAKKDKGGRPTK